MLRLRQRDLKVWASAAEGKGGGFDYQRGGPNCEDFPTL